MTSSAPATLHRKEFARLQRLDELLALDAAPDPALDALVRAAARAARSQGALLNFVTAQHVWSKAAYGTPPMVRARATSPCAHVVAGGEPLALRDAGDAADGQRAYAGVPLHVDGLPVGTLCVFDPTPHDWPGDVVDALRDLATVAEGLLASRRRALAAPVAPAARAATAATHLHDPLPAAAAGAPWLGAAFDALPAAVAVSDANGRIVHANAAWWARLGEDMPAGPPTWPSLVRHLAYAGHHPDAAGREEAFIAWRLGLVSDATQAQPLRWRDGWVVVTDRRLPSGHVVHVTTDQGARQGGESTLIALQQRQLDADAQLSAVLAALPDLWMVIDARGRYSRVSAPRHPSLIRPFEELLSRDFAEGLPPEAAQAAESAMQRARALGRVERFEYTLRHPDGQQRHYEARVSPMPGGEMLYLTRDLTELRMLARDVLLMQRAFESPASLPIVIADAQAPGQPLVYANAAFEQLSGWSRDELAGRPLASLAVAGEPGEAPWVEALERGCDTSLIVEGCRRDGSRYVNEVSLVAARDAQGRTTHLIGLLHDLSERQQAEQARREKLAAEMASRSKSQFMSRMSHEMRTPLNAIIGFAQLLRQQAGARVDHVDHILNAGQHLLQLVNDVLDLQRVEGGDLALNIAPVAVAPLLHDCVAMLGPMADSRGVRQIVDDPAPPAGLHVVADAQRLRQVLLNIGSNAVKYNRPAGRVHWSVGATDDGQAWLRIADTGAGMTADQLARLFQPFERLGRDTSSIEGTGLGLVIARRLVEEMGGRLELGSRQGEGTTVTIRLATAAREAGAGPTEAMPTPGLPVGASVEATTVPERLRLLYVEDNRINALLFEEALRPQPGFEVRVVEDGGEALDAVREWTPHVLVLDANLPGASGHEVLRELRQLDALAGVPAYMCSADAMPDDVQRALDAGFRGYWTKPLDIGAVIAELRTLHGAIGGGR